MLRWRAPAARDRHAPAGEGPNRLFAVCRFVGPMLRAIMSPMSASAGQAPKKIVVFANTFLDELLTHPPDEHTGRETLDQLVADGLAEVDYRCRRDPATPLTAGELAGVSITIADLEHYTPELLAAVGVGRAGSPAAGHGPSARSDGGAGAANSATPGAGRLELIARYGVGVDAVDLDAAEAAGVAVSNTPGANSLPTAEWSVSTLLSVAGRRVAQHTLASQGRGKTGPSRLDVTGKTLGIVGTGRIGQRVAMLVTGFSMDVLAYDLYPNDEWARNSGARYVELDELLAESDFVTLHASSTEKIIGARELDLMKPTACLINCARAHLVDDDEVYARVKDGRLFGYGMDDPWRRSDLPLGGDLAFTLNIVCGPHVGSETDQGKVGMRTMSARAVDQWIRTGSTDYRVR